MLKSGNVMTNHLCEENSEDILQSLERAARDRGSLRCAGHDDIHRALCIPKTSAWS